jgi:hypothetical protein
LNLPRAAQTLLQGGVFLTKSIGEIGMPKATRASMSIHATSSEKSEGHPLVSIALFCGIGLLASLVATLMGVQGAWY